ncbi:hypothetical protein IWX90DRAFT_516989 [Phyllosticta citrichinensis]|uniref:Uncharacterized protein n=1 Tax=Phyllosticta citrichinensis TaxID=1130410 RepID=A0ABR1XGY2_9PEZI
MNTPDDLEMGQHPARRDEDESTSHHNLDDTVSEDVDEASSCGLNLWIPQQGSTAVYVFDFIEAQDGSYESQRTTHTALGTIEQSVATQESQYAPKKDSYQVLLLIDCGRGGFDTHLDCMPSLLSYFALRGAPDPITRFAQSLASRYKENDEEVISINMNHGSGSRGLYLAWNRTSFPPIPLDLVGVKVDQFKETFHSPLRVTAPPSLNLTCAEKQRVCYFQMPGTIVFVLSGNSRTYSYLAAILQGSVFQLVTGSFVTEFLQAILCQVIPFDEGQILNALERGLQEIDKEMIFSKALKQMMQVMEGWQWIMGHGRAYIHSRRHFFHQVTRALEDIQHPHELIEQVLEESQRHNFKLESIQRHLD